MAKNFNSALPGMRLLIQLIHRRKITQHFLKAPTCTEARANEPAGFSISLSKPQQR